MKFCFICEELIEGETCAVCEEIRARTLEKSSYEELLRVIKHESKKGNYITNKPIVDNFSLIVDKGELSVSMTFKAVFTKSIK